MTVTLPRPPAASAGPAVVCESLLHIYRHDDTEVVALRGLDLEVAHGETIALLGPSGSGKTTLLALLAGLLKPSAGRAIVAGHDLATLTERQLLGLRREQIGVLLQHPGRNLLPYASVIENLRFALRAGNHHRSRRHALGLLNAVGLDGAASKPVPALSGGEQQRLAVAVSLANHPRILLADEPTSQLDPETSAQIVTLLQAACQNHGTTLLVVTHDPAVAQAMDRTVIIRDGRVGAEARPGRHQQLAVVGRDGSVQLPDTVLDLLPPGSLARVIRRHDGVELRRTNPRPDSHPDQPARQESRQGQEPQA